MNFLIMLITLAAVMTGPSHGIVSERVEYKYEGTTLVGDVFYNPDMKGLRPGVLVIHEWWGLNDYPKMRAEQLAKLGYIAFAVDMYGDGAVAATPEEAGKMAGAVRGDVAVLRGRINAALDVLRARPDVDPKRIAAIGYCFGGGVALELARSGSDVAGVVSFHGVLSTTAPGAEGGIKAKVLVLHGADDKSAPLEQVTAFQEEMRSAGADWEMVFYGGAVHGFTNPANGDDPSKGVAYNAEADKRSWAAMLSFFDEIFAP